MLFDQLVPLIILGLVIVVFIQSAQLRSFKLDLREASHRLDQLTVQFHEHEAAIDIVNRWRKVHEELHHDR